MVNEATISAYKAMAKDSECPSMETQIRENLERTCDKFAGNEDKLDRCISYLEDCASQILDGKSGDVPDEVCFRISVERDISVDPKKRTLADLLKAYGEKAPSWWEEKASA